MEKTALGPAQARPLADDVEAAQILEAEKELVLEGGEDPHKWSRARKIRNNVVLAYATFVLTYSSSAMTPSLAGFIAFYGVSREVALLSLALFVLGFGLGPFLAGPTSEVVGRRNVYIVTYVSFTAWSWGAAYAPNIVALIIFRFLAGLSGSSSLTVHPASISDWASIQERNRYSSSYALCAFGGASIGPLVGGFVVVYASWRWNLIVIAILVSVSALAIIVGAEETYAPELLKRKNKRHGRAVPPGPSLGARYYTAIVTPFKLLVKEPAVAAVSLYLSFLYGLFYALFPVYPIIYVQVRGFSQQALALTYIAPTLGFLLGGIVLRYGQDYAYSKWMEKMPPGKMPPPNARYVLVQWLSWTVPVGIFILAFCSYANLHWFGDCVGAFLFSFGMLIVFTGFIPFIIDLYLRQAASALAATTASRAIFAASFPLFSANMYERLGIPGASGLLAGIALLLFPIPWIFTYYGNRLWGHRL